MTEMTNNDWLTIRSTAEKVRNIEKHHHRNIRYHMDEIATRQSAEFAMRYLMKAQQFASPEEIMYYALDRAPKRGLALEFGVATGNTLRQIAKARHHDVHGFDSFEGLPEDWKPGYPAGTFAGVDPGEFPEHVTLHRGLFQDTLPPLIDETRGNGGFGLKKVDFVHIDCDLYSSTVFVLHRLKEGGYFQKGTVILFDEFFNYPGWQNHEARALAEIFTFEDIEFIAFNYRSEQLAVRLR